MAAEKTQTEAERAAYERWRKQWDDGEAPETPARRSPSAGMNRQERFDYRLERFGLPTVLVIIMVGILGYMLRRADEAHEKFNATMADVASSVQKLATAVQDNARANDRIADRLVEMEKQHRRR